MTMTEKRWISINQTPYRRPVHQQMGTATVVTSTSPYSVPQAITAYGDKTSGNCVFEVKYIGAEEPVEPMTIGDYSTLYFGKNSKRLFRVSVRPEHFAVANKDSFVEAVKEAIGQVEEKP